MYAILIVDFYVEPWNASWCANALLLLCSLISPILCNFTCAFQHIFTFALNLVSKSMVGKLLVKCFLRTCYEARCGALWSLAMTFCFIASRVKFWTTKLVPFCMKLTVVCRKFMLLCFFSWSVCFNIKIFILLPCMFLLHIFLPWSWSIHLLALVLPVHCHHLNVYF